MFPKTLLMVIGSEQPTDDVERVIAFCQEAECHLAVLVIGIALPTSASAYGAVPAETWTIGREKGRETATRKGTDIEALMKEAGISGDVATYFCDEGQIADIVGMRGRYTDLGLFLPSADQDERLSKKSLEGFVYQSARPFLVVPPNAAVVLRPKRVLVGWNSTREAARAVYDSLDVLANADAVHVTMVDPVAGEFDQGEEPGGDLAAYLARMNVKVTVDVLASAGRPVAEVLMQHATDMGADVIVAGAYGHSRLREFLFGGATRDLLADSRIPVLMSH